MEDYIQKKIGGSRVRRNINKKHPKWHDQEEWRVDRIQDVYNLLKLLYPYLILKKQTCKNFLIEIKKYGVGHEHK